MIQIPAATPAETGKNRGKVTAYEWSTAIKPKDNATGLPVSKAGKVTVTVAGDSIQVSQFENYNEIREVAGDNYERVALDLFNTKLAAAQLQSARVAFGKLTAAPLDTVAYARERIAAFEVASLFVKQERAKAVRQSRDAKLLALAENAKNMTPEDITAQIMELLKGRA